MPEIVCEILTRRNKIIIRFRREIQKEIKKGKRESFCERKKKLLSKPKQNRTKKKAKIKPKHTARCSESEQNYEQKGEKGEGGRRGEGARERVENCCTRHAHINNSKATVAMAA